MGAVLDEDVSAADVTSELLAGIDAVAKRLTDTIIPASKAIDVLLELWSSVHEVDTICAEPVEELLTALVGRSCTTPAELSSTLDRTRALITRC